MALPIKHESGGPKQHRNCSSKRTRRPRAESNGNEKEHETANCITYSYAAAAVPPTHVSLPCLGERICNSVVVVGDGGNTLFGSGSAAVAEDDRSQHDSSLETCSLADLGIAVT